jgi:hypothetical protein
MSITAAKPVTKSEFDERMALAKTYGPHAVANLAAEFRRRSSPVELDAQNAFGFVNLQKCGLEVATGAVEIDEPRSYLSKRLRVTKRRTRYQRDQAELDRLEREMAATDGPPTKEQLEKHALLVYGDNDFRSSGGRGDLDGGTFTKSYTPTQTQIAQHDDLLINSAGI